VSLAPLAARKADHVSRDVASVLAIEILAACRGLDLRRPLRSGRGVDAAYEAVRARVPAQAEDRVLAPEIEAVREMVLAGELLEAAESRTARYAVCRRSSRTRATVPYSPRIAALAGAGLVPDAGEDIGTRLERAGHVVADRLRRVPASDHQCERGVEDGETNSSVTLDRP
jgi:hypothetical protein